MQVIRAAFRSTFCWEIGLGSCDQNWFDFLSLILLPWKFSGQTFAPSAVAMSVRIVNLEKHSAEVEVEHHVVTYIRIVKYLLYEFIMLTLDFWRPQVRHFASRKSWVAIKWWIEEASNPCWYQILGEMYDCLAGCMRISLEHPDSNWVARLEFFIMSDILSRIQVM